MEIQNNIEAFAKKLENTRCRLVAVSKTKPVGAIKQAYDAGQRLFGENKVQELVAKHPELPDDIEWHMIGHLQRNKVKYIAPFISLIHSVDSQRLLEAINKEARKNDRMIDVLLQVHIAREETKYGFDEDELFELIHDIDLPALTHIRIVGLMGMATNTDNIDVIRDEFQSLAQLFKSLQGQKTPDNVVLKELSMGMSGDYEVAIKEGSTLIRVGSAIFGERNYA